MRTRRIYQYIYPLLMIAFIVMAIGCEISESVTPAPGPGGGTDNPADTTSNPIDTTGGNGGDTTALGIEVSISPAEASVLAGSTEQFFADVVGTANVDVIWSVASGPGSISEDGTYTAPAVINVDTVMATVKATAKADSRATATARVTITKPAPGGGGGGGGGGGDTLLPGQVCFERDVLPIFTSNCAMSGCHDRATARDGKIFTDYSGIIREIEPGRPRSSEIYEKITEDDEDDRMPPPPKNRLTAEQIATIRKWIEQGALNTKCDEPGGTDCDTVNVTFSGTVRPILQNNCVGCHSGPTPPRGLNLSSYTGVRTAALNGKLYGAISHAPGFPAMPQGAKKLGDCHIRQIKAWIDKGAPNN
jgi:mono/diheme cytochrome c family protein